MPKVTVIIPVYGVEKYISRCARSLFEQTLDDIEYIFVDDCTKDNSIGVLQEVLEQYPQRREQTRIVKLLVNSGQAAARKYGMQLATGDYIIHCDGDDGDKYEGWSSYVSFGGLPLTITMATDEQRMEYLTSLFEETYIKDIIERNHIEKVQEINDLINILASGIGSLTNASKIKATFKSVIQSDISLNTIRAYIDHLKDAFIVNEVNRYDVKGRKYIGTPLKYYFEDVGLRNARLGFRQVEETHLMENVIYNELRVRGYQVDVGVVVKRDRTEEGVQEKKQLEIDFVANMGSKRYYIQSAFSLPDDKKRAQEKASLINVNDSFKKIIIVKDVVKPLHDNDGILTMSIYDFLLNEHSLEL